MILLVAFIGLVLHVICMQQTWQILFGCTFMESLKDDVN
jgi:hypothetical protein